MVQRSRARRGDEEARVVLGGSGEEGESEDDDVGHERDNEDCGEREGRVVGGAEKGEAVERRDASGEGQEVRGSHAGALQHQLAKLINSDSGLTRTHNDALATNGLLDGEQERSVSVGRGVGG